MMSKQETVTLPCVACTCLMTTARCFEKQAKILGHSTFYRINGGEGRSLQLYSIQKLQMISEDFVQNNADKVTLSRQLESVHKFFQATV